MKYPWNSELIEVSKDKLDLNPVQKRRQSKRKYKSSQQAVCIAKNNIPYRNGRIDGRFLLIGIDITLLHQVSL